MLLTPRLRMLSGPFFQRLGPNRWIKGVGNWWGLPHGRAPYAAPTVTIAPAPPRTTPITLTLALPGSLGGKGAQATISIDTTGGGMDVQDVTLPATATLAQVVTAVLAAWSNPDTTVAAAGGVITVTPKAGKTINALTLTFTEVP